MDGEMTYQEMLDYYYANGGGPTGAMEGDVGQGAMRPVIMPDGQRLIINEGGIPMMLPYEEGWGGGMQSLRNAIGVLGGTAAFGNLAMPYLAGSGAAAPVGSAAALGGGDAAALAAAENGILGSTVGMAPGTAAAYGTGAAASGAALGGSLGGSSLLPAAAAAGGASMLGGSTASGLLGQAGNFLGNNTGALLSAGLGAAAGIAGNGDLTNTSTTTGTNSSNSLLNSSQNNSQTGASALSGTSTNSLAPWLQGYAQDYVGRAQNQLNQGSTNPDMQMAQGQLRGLAQNGDPLVNSALRQQQSVISGDYLNSNPYIDQVARGIGDRMGEAYATGTRGSLTSNAQMSGNDPRYSSAYQQTVGNADRAYGDALGQAMSGLYMGNYQNERQNQNQAAQYSTNLANFGVANTGNLLQSGVQQQQMPWQMLQNYGQAINPAFGSTSTNNQIGNTAQTGMQTGMQTGWQTGNTSGTQNQNIQAPNNWMAGIGGAAAGAGIYRNLFGG